MKKFTEILGGRVDVKSEIRRGSTFVVRLPVGAVTDASDLSLPTTLRLREKSYSPHILKYLFNCKSLVFGRNEQSESAFREADGRSRLD